jgi:flagellar motility protein MotE (MotC chaperone)
MDLETIKTKLSEIKKSLLGQEEIKLEAQTQLEDGTVIGTTADEFAAGVDVYTIIDGETQPLPAGQYMTQDGYTLTVAEEGVVESYEVVEEEEEEMSEEDPGKDLLVQTIGVLENLLQEYSEVKEKLSAIETKLEAEVEEETPEAAEEEITLSAEPKAKTVSRQELKGMSQKERSEYILNQSK